MTILATTQPAFALTPDNHDDHGHRGYYGGHGDHGISPKDQTVFSSVNATRDTHKTSHDVFDKVSTTSAAVEVAVERNGRSAELATEKNGRSGELTTTVASGALGVAIQATAAATNLAIQVSDAKINLLAVQNASAAALAAATNHAAILLELCKCCGKTDELIRQEAGKTRQLIQDNTAADLRDKLHNAQTAIIIANSKLVGGPIVV